MTIRSLKDERSKYDDILNVYDQIPIVYLIRRNSTNQYYVGSTLGLISRLYNGFYGHIGSLGIAESPDYIHEVMTKFGIDEFSFIIEEEFSTLDEARDSESYYIKKYDSFRNGYNKTINGLGGSAGCVKMSKGTSRVAVKPTEVEKYLDLGYVIGTSRVVMVDPSGEFFRVKLEDVPKYESMGYTKGGAKSLSTTRGTISMYDPITKESKKVMPSEVDEYTRLGWVTGFICNKGRKHLYHPDTGDSRSESDPDLIKELKNSGYLSGKIIRKGLVLMNDTKKSEFYCTITESRNYMKLGYKFGRIKQSIITS